MRRAPREKGQRLISAISALSALNKMELRLYLRILLRWWWLVAIPSIVIGAVGLITYHRPPTTYGTTIRFSASLPPTLTDNPGFDPSYYSWRSEERRVGKEGRSR